MTSPRIKTNVLPGHTYCTSRRDLPTWENAKILQGPRNAVGLLHPSQCCQKFEYFFEDAGKGHFKDRDMLLHLTAGKIFCRKVLYISRVFRWNRAGCVRMGRKMLRRDRIDVFRRAVRCFIN